MIDTAMVKSLLTHSVYEESKERLRASLFAEDVRDVYRILVDAHEKYGKDLTTGDLMALWSAQNPVATAAQKNDFRELVEDIEDAQALTGELVPDTITALWRRDTGKKIASMGLEISEGSDAVMAQLRELVESVGDGFVADDFGEDTSQELEDLLDMFGDDHRFKFNIPTLSNRVYGIGPQEFGIVFATPETGKTAFIVSLCCGPDGFTDQGKKVVILGNEEATKRTVVRAYQCVTGFTGEQIKDDPEKAIAIYKGKTRDKLVFKDIQDWTLEKVNAYLAKKKPDVVIIDQLDKVSVDGKFEKGHERLRELYRQAREMAKRHNCALIGVSQASNDASGRTRLDYSMMEGSKIGKAAEADLIIGIGKDQDDESITRYLTVSKNKLSGWHGTILAQIQPEISRYVA
jgi:replicative DNA helicase